MEKTEITPDVKPVEDMTTDEKLTELVIFSRTFQDAILRMESSGIFKTISALTGKR